MLSILKSVKYMSDFGDKINAVVCYLPARLFFFIICPRICQQQIYQSLKLIPPRNPKLEARFHSLTISMLAIPRRDTTRLIEAARLK